MVATSSHIPKVFLSFANAHMDDLNAQREQANGRQMSPEGGRMTAMTGLDYSDDEEEDGLLFSKRLANSADKTKDIDTHYETFQNQCKLDLDPIEYMRNFEETNMASTRQGDDEEVQFVDIFSTTGRDGRIRKVFADSPKLNKSAKKTDRQQAT